jgi:nitrilase
LPIKTNEDASLTVQNDIVRVAAVQASPVFLDRDASVEKAARLIAEAARKGATLAAFGEGWLPGYPIHAASAASSELWWEFAAEYLNQSVDIPGPAIEALCKAAFHSNIDVAIGVSERDAITRGSVYSTHLLISRDGKVIGRHRKLKPALNERLVWGDGDAVGLHVHDREYANVTGLCGSEHQMILPTYALVEQGTQIHVACWPGGEPAAPPAPIALWPRQHLLSRAFAAQAGAYVICAAGVLNKESVPERYQPLFGQELDGRSIVIDPRGEVIAGPVEGETIIVADCSMALVRAAKVAFDGGGHSARKDQLSFRNQAFGGGDEESGQPEMGDDGFGADPPPQEGPPG